MFRSLIRPIVLFLFALFAAVSAVSAQSFTASTVTRPPFSMPGDEGETGFSMDLLNALANRIGVEVNVQRINEFPEMLGAVKGETADLAIANISITAQREADMDFSQPIFESGLQIMVPHGQGGQASLMHALFSTDILVAVLISFLALLIGGMLMWVFERRAQPYFDRPLPEAWFPSFWWALNLVVNGGFEERMPRSFFGRIFGVLLVVSSLFIVSVFVAKITAAMTVEAITGSINNVNDLYGHRVGTIEGSTAAGFMDRREIDFQAYGTLESLLAAFEAGSLEAVVFDAPILSYYAAHDGAEFGRMVGQIFLRENYGIAFPSGSPLVEEFNQSLLGLREDGSYDKIHRKWFGNTP